MEKSRNRTQMNKQENSPEEQLDEKEANNTSDREFRVVVIRILSSLIKRHRIHKKGPVTNKDCNI